MANAPAAACLLLDEDGRVLRAVAAGLGVDQIGAIDVGVVGDDDVFLAFVRGHDV